ncbi:MAG: thymidine kinase [Oscillospiraceae bacterium]|nr:thymidine kinase [Oscillospiraceae bacterium]
MAKLYFRYGAMGASKSANALMVRYNYEERGQRALLVKPVIDQREGKAVVHTRIGLSHPCIWADELQKMPDEEIRSYQCIIVDEAQFLTKEQVFFLTEVVDRLDVPVICYGLRADFKGELFSGSEALLAWADIIEEIKTICWCGRKATCNARFDENGRVVKDGKQVVLGGHSCYISLCRKHWKEGNLGPRVNQE